MRLSQLILIAALPAWAACAKNSTATEAPGQSPSGNTTDNAKAIQWGPAPAIFPAGAEFAVMEGDPSKAEPFTVRLRLPNGYKLPAHTHPTTENVTVITGTFLAGMGSKFVESTMAAYSAGNFASIPANHPHYAMARGTTVVQVHAMGPFALTYVNPADTPKAATGTR